VPTCSAILAPKKSYSKKDKKMYLENKGDCWSEEDADITTGLPDEMAKFVNEKHGDMGLPTSRAEVHYDVLLLSPLAKI
jgi:hypothetical protein